MEEYIVSARKYRPATFDSVVGQNALTVTLKNAIASGKLAHAYLFCGPRGVGKTTCARIFAKTINCLNPLPNHEACNECESCKAFNEQRSLNIHELDAASNNSIEDIRSLIEQVRVPPQVGKYKVFIIDEVHMLSTAAFNAFLKTLEEPPAHVIFILATTEKHKILPTILSRCQIYDFNRMSPQLIVSHLKNVADNEHISYEPEALEVIAQKADGGMRDALSIFDQAVSFAGGKLTYQKTIENLNILDDEYYFRMTDHFLKNEIPQCMLLLNEILQKGFEGGHFISGLAEHFRNLMVSHDPSTLVLLEKGESTRQRYQEQARHCRASFLYQGLKLCNDCDMNYRNSKNKRLLLEITLIQLAQTAQDEEAGSGRSPEKILKPLFDTLREQASGEKASTAANSSKQATAPQTQKPHKEEHPSNPDTRAKHLSSPGIIAKHSPLPEIEEENPKKAVVKLGQLSPSIRRQNQDTDNTTGRNGNGQGTATQAADPAEDYLVTEKDICFYWHEFANLLPQEETAIAKRMKIMQPHLLENEQFEIVVDNEQVKQFLQEIAPRIEAHLRQKLHNRKISMHIRVAEAGEKTRVYTKVEQFQAMAKKNPNLLKLKELFGLELT